MTNKDFRKLVLTSSLIISTFASLNFNEAYASNIIVNSNKPITVVDTTSLTEMNKSEKIINMNNSNDQTQLNESNQVIISSKNPDTSVPLQKLSLLFLSIGGVLSALSLLSISLAKKSKNVNKKIISKIESELDSENLPSPNKSLKL